MSDTNRPSRLATSLDIDSARERAAQAAVLSDPVNLRILSDLAAGGLASALPAKFMMDAVEMSRRLGRLTHVGLLQAADPGGFMLTADSWVRFGRLLTGTTTDGAARSATSLAALPSALTTVINDLAYRFYSTFAPETVSRYVVESYLLLTHRVQAGADLLSLTARYAADRLEALASVQGLRLHSAPEVLFVCVHNAGRSQMAGAFMRHLAGGRVHVRTAGSSPAAEAHPRVIEAMAELDIPIWGEFPKPLTDEVVRAADYVVTMGCGDACPVFPGRRYLEWDLDDPLALDGAGLRRVRDEIRERVVGLLAEMGQAERQ